MDTTFTIAIAAEDAEELWSSACSASIVARQGHRFEHVCAEDRSITVEACRCAAPFVIGGMAYWVENSGEVALLRGYLRAIGNQSIRLWDLIAAEDGLLAHVVLTSRALDHGPDGRPGSSR